MAISRNQQFRGGVRALGLKPIGKRRLAAHLRARDQGAKRSGPGRPKAYDGKGNGNDLWRFENVETDDDDIGRSHQVRNHPQFQCTLQVVLVGDTKPHRRAGRFRTDVDVEAMTISRSSTARVQIEFRFRDAKQFPGLTHWQARSHAKLTVHFKASVSRGPLAPRAARQQNADATSGVSMARLTRRAFNQQLIERMSQH